MAFYSPLRTVENQFVETPFLDTLDNLLIQPMENQTELEIWTQNRLAAGRPIPNGKIVLPAK